MPRSRRAWIAEETGSYHIISRVADRTVWFSDEEKEHFVHLLNRLSRGFYVKIHAFCVMGNHFHILATGCESAATDASPTELAQRYRAMYGRQAEPPMGRTLTTGEVEADDDLGTQRLRERLGSISRFVQEIKQSFSRYYNKRHDRKGFLWSDRFKGVLVSKGDAQLACAAYIDLNPVRAKLDGINIPEDYRFSSMGLKARSPRRWRELITDIEDSASMPVTHAHYRAFVYTTGAVEDPNKAGSISKAAMTHALKRSGKMGLHQTLRYRIRNFSEGVAIGSESFIANMQSDMRRKFIRPRAFLESSAPPLLFSTRVLREPSPRSP